MVGAGLVAFDRRCPHLGCPVLWSRDKASLAYPLLFRLVRGRPLTGTIREQLALTPDQTGWSIIASVAFGVRFADEAEAEAEVREETEALLKRAA